MDALFRYWFILKRRRYPAIAVFSIIMAVVSFFAVTAKPIYQADGQLLLQENDLGEIANPFGSGKNNETKLNTEAEIIRSQPIVDKAISAIYDERSKRKPKYKDFSGALFVKNLRGTNILEVSYLSTNSQEAAQFVNALLAVYMTEDVRASRREAQLAREFIEQQLPKVEQSVRLAEQALRQFKESNKLVSLDAETAATVTSIQSLESEIDKNQSELAAALAQSKDIQNRLGFTADIGIPLSSPSVQQLLSDVQETEKKLTLERSRYREDHPVIADLRLKQLSLRTLLQERLGAATASQFQKSAGSFQLSQPQQNLISQMIQAEVNRFSAEARIRALNESLATYRDRTKIYPKLEQQQRELERQLKAAQATYETLLAKLQEVRVAENQTTGNARVVSAAIVPVQPISAGIVTNLMRGVLLALAGSVGITLLLEWTDKSLKTVEEAKQLSEHPILGIIPNLEAMQRNMGMDSVTPASWGTFVKDFPLSPTSDAFRMLLANLRFLNSDTHLKVLVVASSVSGEGKSTVTSNLALAMCQLGNRVLVIDADMRKPRQHKVWNLANGLGLSNVLTRQAEFFEARQPVLHNLDVLTAGVVPPNPTALVSSNMMEVLLEASRQAYDYVLIDTPPLTIGADTSILGKLADGILLIVRPKVSDRGSLAFTLQSLNQANQNLLGLAINGVTPDDDSHFSYYYYVNEYYHGKGIQAESESVSESMY